jgi:hypothetical protein
MKLSMTDDALALARQRGGTIAIDFIPPIA